MNTCEQPSLFAPGDCEELDRVAHVPRVPEILGLHPAYALSIDGIDRHLRTERQPRQDCDLVQGVEAVDVCRRVGFRVAEGLRLGEGLLEIYPVFRHARQNVVRCPVDDCPHTDDAVREKVI